MSYPAENIHFVLISVTVIQDATLTQVGNQASGKQESKLCHKKTCLHGFRNQLLAEPQKLVNTLEFGSKKKKA